VQETRKGERKRKRKRKRTISAGSAYQRMNVKNVERYSNHQHPWKGRKGIRKEITAKKEKNFDEHSFSSTLLPSPAL
jgi:hypothetical protein